MRGVLAFVCALLALPVLSVLGAWLAFDDAALQVLQHQWHTVLPGYVWQSLVLALGTAIGTAAVGGMAAALVTLFEFRGRRWFEAALLLPLAMPAYVLAYAYTDFLQYSGPLQSALRAATGASGALWPDVRSLPAAIVLFVLCLYPYVYLLARTALAERGVHLMESARLLGAGLRRRIVEVALPLARPAIAAGVSLAVMETLADYGVGSYFGLTTFSTGIYKAWLVMFDRIAAAQLASLLLLLVALLLFSINNWQPVEVKIWEGLVLETRLPALVIVSFLAGLLPMWLLHKGARWRLNRRIASLENSVRSVTITTPMPAQSANAPANALDADAAPPHSPAA